jgi:biotin synthase-related radical SAM superfamily protein
MGASIRSLLNQNENERLEIDVQAILLSLVFTSMSSGRDYTFFVKNYKSLTESIATQKEFATIRKEVKSEKNFDQFLSRLEKLVPIFNKVCHE